MVTDTLLLDKRTQSLVENYVPSGEVLDGLVCFFSVFADSTRSVSCPLWQSRSCASPIFQECWTSTRPLFRISCAI